MEKVKFSEAGIINYLQKIIKKDNDVFVGIGDDAAVLKFNKEKYLLYTCDMIIEGTHFTKDARPFEIGHKALAVAASDIAAMGGIPRYAVVSLGLPRASGFRFVKDFYKGLLNLAKELKINIVGGDTDRASKITVDVSMIGFVEKKNLVLRSGAKMRDYIFVSGRLGGSIYGRHLNFMPQIGLARYLVNNFKIHAMIDLSDGLAQDLYRLTDASKSGALIYEEFIPLAEEAKRFKEALCMGEDFQLLFTVPESVGERLIRLNRRKLFYIGVITDKKSGLRIVSRSGHAKQLRLGGFSHF